MATLAGRLQEALGAWSARRLAVAELASWAEGVRGAWLSDPANRYAFREDRQVEALGLLAGAAGSPDPEADVREAQTLLHGEAPFTVSRTLLLDPRRLAELAAAAAVRAAADLGARLERGEDWTRAVPEAAPALTQAARALAGDDYAELLVLEAVSLCEDLRLAVGGTVEVLGPGRARVDAALLSERIAQIGQVLRGERPVRATVRSRDADLVTVVLSF